MSSSGKKIASSELRHRNCQMRRVDGLESSLALKEVLDIEQPAARDRYIVVVETGNPDAPRHRECTST